LPKGLSKRVIVKLASTATKQVGAA
jgi:hypothetical protein